MMAGSRKCYLCLASQGTDKCEKCEKVFSCSQHMKTHVMSSGSCYPYKVEYDVQKGRYLVATRTITPGEVISREAAAVVGPCTRSKPQCLQCFKLISSSTRFDCSGCGFPVCDEECMRGSLHLEECQLFRSVGYRADVGKLDVWDRQYSAITVLRLLRCVDEEHSRNNEHEHATGLIHTLEDHDDDRRVGQPETWQIQKVLIVDFIQQTLGLKDEYSEEDIRRATGVLMTNATSLQLPSSGYGIGIALFPIYAMGNHSCFSNTKTVITPGQKLEIIAQIPIEAGQEITNQYMRADKPTYTRQAYLKEKWFFDCLCSRCSDPTECGSHLSSLLCSGAKCGGAVVPSTPLDNQSDWFCLECGAVAILERVKKVLEFAGVVIGSPSEETDDIVEHFERILHRMSPLLHPYNYLLIDVKHKLAMLYGHIPQYRLAGMSRPAKQRKIQLCHDVIDCVSKIEVGVSPTHTKFLNEIIKTEEVVAKEDIQAGLIDKKSLQTILLKSKFQLLHLAFLQSKLTQKLSLGT